jgi:hypothetical protein
MFDRVSLGSPRLAPMEMPTRRGLAERAAKNE